MQLKRYIEGIIEVEEIHDIIDVGTTMPVRCRLKNGTNVIVKYMRNPFGQQVLVNEIIGSCIADIIGLTIPEYGVCNLLESVINNTNYNEDMDKRNAGFAFYTKDYSSTIPPTTAMLPLVENKETERIILFDHIVNNCDRHMGNLLLDLSKNATLYVIDNSHIITERNLFSIEYELTDEAIYSKRVFEKNRDIYDRLCIGVGYSEEKMFLEAQRIQSEITEEVLNDIKNLIPDQWAVSVGKEILDMMLNVVCKRVKAISDLCCMIVEERRK